MKQKHSPSLNQPIVTGYRTYIYKPDMLVTDLLLMVHAGSNFKQKAKQSPPMAPLQPIPWVPWEMCWFWSTPPVVQPPIFESLPVVWVAPSSFLGTSTPFAGLVGHEEYRTLFKWSIPPYVIRSFILLLLYVRNWISPLLPQDVLQFQQSPLPLWASSAQWSTFGKVVPTYSTCNIPMFSFSPIKRPIKRFNRIQPHFFRGLKLTW